MVSFIIAVVRNLNDTFTVYEEICRHSRHAAFDGRRYISFKRNYSHPSEKNSKKTLDRILADKK